MDGLFNSAFDAAMAWNQAGLLLGGIIMAGIGGLLFGYDLYRRTVCDRVTARIVGIRATGIKGESVSQGEESGENKIKAGGKKGKASGLAVLLIAGIPLLFVGVGLYFAYDYYGLLSGGVETQAVVVDNEYERSDDGGSYHAIVSFRDSSGREWRVRDRMGKGGSPFYDAGERVAVHYDPSSPEHVAVGGFWHNMLLPVVFAGMGGLFLFLLFFAPNMKKKPSQAVGVVKQSYAREMYYPVFEYASRGGEKIRGEDGGGGNWLTSVIPGTSVTLLVNPRDPQDVLRTGFLMPLLGSLFAVPGIVMLYISFARFDFNVFTVLFLPGIAGFLAAKARKFVKPRDQWETRAAFRKRMKEKQAAKRGTGRFLTAQEICVRVRYQDNMARRWLFIPVLLSVSLLALGVHLGKDMKSFLLSASTVDGAVVRIERTYGSGENGGYAYYPVVSFRASSGDTFEFRDKVGSNPPLYREAESVAVIYDTDNPRHAIIDRGLMNWAGAGGSALAGFLLLIWAIRSHAGIWARQGRIRQNP
ncbi:MAG: DUF3592 domain-containing protein [Proteobacteria bacterium]|nr:DUF3592 domain-containing protein [Pseudomonadota bacterium]